jgi:capsular polysaccharide transport system permease protein
MDDSRGLAPGSSLPSDESQNIEDRAADANVRPAIGRLSARPKVVSQSGGLEMPSVVRVSSVRPLPSPADRLESPFAQPRVYREAEPAPDEVQEPPRPDDRPASGGRIVPPLPRARTVRWSPALVSFLVVVALPILVSSVYYGLIAANQYVAEFHFSVRSQTTVMAPTATAAPLTTSTSPALLGSGMVSTSSGQADPQDMLSNYAVIDYLTSQQAVSDLEAKLPLKSYFTTKDADWFARLGDSATRERVVRYWQHMIDADYDPATGLATVKVRAFTPADALAIAKVLSASSESLVNKIEDRAREDSVTFAQKMVDRDEATVQAISRELFELRKKSGTIDPTSNLVNENNQVSLALVQSLVQLRTQYAAQLSQMHNPDAPTLRSLRDQIAATEDQLAQARGNVSSSGKGEVLPAVVGQFESMQLRQQLAQQSLTASVANLEAARASAISQTLYVMNHVEAQLPERSEYPKRLLTILLIGLGAFGLWVSGILVTHTVRSHLS